MPSQGTEQRLSAEGCHFHSRCGKRWGQTRLPGKAGGSDWWPAMPGRGSRSPQSDSSAWHPSTRSPMFQRVAPSPPPYPPPRLKQRSSPGSWVSHGARRAGPPGSSVCRNRGSRHPSRDGVCCLCSHFSLVFKLRLAPSLPGPNALLPGALAMSPCRPPVSANPDTCASRHSQASPRWRPVLPGLSPGSAAGHLCGLSVWPGCSVPQSPDL